MNKGFPYQLLLIVIYSLITRLFLFGVVPIPTSQTHLLIRFISTLANILVIPFLYKWVLQKTAIKKVALLVCYTYVTLFWTFEQGRIYSLENISVLLLVFFYYLISIKSNIGKISGVLILLSVLLINLRLPFTTNLYIVVKNIFTVSSFESIFFRNTYFWWGSVRDFGIINLSFLPFFLVGIINTIHKKEWDILIPLIMLIFGTALAKAYPETRLFYHSVPFFTYIIARGIYSVVSYKKITFLLSFCIFVFLMYELANYFHFYFIHYATDVKNNLYQIKELF